VKPKTNDRCGSKLHVPGASTTRQKYTQLLPERHDAFHGEFVPVTDLESRKPDVRCVPIAGTGGRTGY
jgi:hypothetical protein